MSIRQGNKVIAGHINYHPDLFDAKWADHLLNDVSWLRADTFSWQDGSVYEKAYDHLADDITGKSLSSETIAGITIQFYLADDGHKICPASEESNVASIYSATGVAWYYIIDTVNERFKLPRTKWGMTGLRGNVGDYVEAGLPNITGWFTADNAGFANSGAGGAFGNSSNTSKNRTTGSNASYPTVNFDASRSSSIYGNSTTVQPKATEMYLYFYVGNFTQTAIENTAGITTEEMNNKVDKGHQVITFQAPTAQNNYTWYRKYADGWVEQGGIITNPAETNYTIPVEMADTNYTVFITDRTQGRVSQNAGTPTSTTQFYLSTNGTGSTYSKNWEVKGMAA